MERRRILMDRVIWISLLVVLVNSKSHWICAPNRMSESCQWNLFGWKMYPACGYRQNINEHVCIIKHIDGSRGTFIAKINGSSNDHYCLRFQYLTTGMMMNVCLNFYGKTRADPRNQSRLVSTFCLPKNQTDYHWYPFNILLPINITMINVVTESNHIGINHSLIIKDLAIQPCDPGTTTMNTVVAANATSFVGKRIPWIEYIWISIIILFVPLILFSIIKLIQCYVSHRRVPRPSTVIERIPVPSSNLSQHFYEQPISVILPPSIEISVYDHVRDNYV